MGGKTKLIIIGIIIAIVGFLIYLAFFKTSEQKVSVSSAGYSGTNFNNIKGNVYKTETKNFYESSQSGNVYTGGVNYNLSSSENASSRRYLRNRSGTVNYASTFMNINENEYRNLMRREGDVLAFGTPDPQLEKAIPPLDVPGLSSKSYRANRKFQDSVKPQVCIAIINELYKGKEQIKQMEPEIAKYFILDRLRYIPGFGGLSQSIQDKYVNDVYDSIKNDAPLNVEALCEEITNGKGSALFEKCIKVVEQIIVNDIRDPKQIEKMLLEGMPEFKYLSAEDKKMVVDMIVDGMNQGNLSKEKVCSIITSLIIDKIKDMLIYQQCIMVLNSISAKMPMSAAQVEKELYAIPGFSGLSKAQIKQVVENIMADPMTNGSLDSERHCLDIVGMILALIEGTNIYQACIKVMDEIIQNNITNPATVREKMKEIPGFTVLGSDLQNQITQSVLDAIDDGNLADVKEELCRNITALIIDELNKNNIFQQCRVILQGIVDKGILNDETKVREELKKIPNFSILPANEVDKIVKDVMAIDVNGDVNLQIINLCTYITSLITDYLKQSELFKMCVKMMDEIISEGLTTEAEVREKLSKIPGFTLLAKKDQDNFVSLTMTAISEGNLEQKKEEICVLITSAIIDFLEKNELFQKCVQVVTAIFTAGKNKDRDYILEQLKTLPKFTSFSIDVQSKYVDQIIAIEEPDISGKISVFCASYVADVDKLGNIVQCVKKLASIVIYENRNMLREDVRGHMGSVPSFVTSSRAKQERLIDRVMDLLAEQAKNSEEKLYQDVARVASEAFKLTPEKLKTHAEALKILQKIPNFSKLSLLVQNDLAKDLTAVANSCGSQNPKDCDTASSAVFRRISNSVLGVSTLTFEVQLSEFTKICNDLESVEKPTVVKPITEKPITERPTKPEVTTPESTISKPVIGTTNNDNATLGTGGNLVTVQRDAYGKCAILNRNIFEAYSSYIIESSTNPSIEEEHKITELNNRQPDGEYYIPQQYVQVIEEGLIEDFEKILSNEGANNRYNSIARTLYSKFANSQVTTLEKLTVQTKSTLVSRVYKDLDFLRKVSIYAPDLSQAYIVETGKCINPLKDAYSWLLASERMQLFIEGKEESPLNFVENSNPELMNEKVKSTPNYNLGIEKINSLLPGKPDSKLVLLRLNEIPRFGEINDSQRYKAVSGVINLANKCNAYNSCKKEVEEIAFNIAYHSMVLPDARQKTPEELANVAKCFDYSNLGQYSKTDQLFAMLPLDTRNLIAYNLWLLMQNFELSAKEKRREIVEILWRATKSEFVNASNAGRAPIPVSVGTCEGAMNEVWGIYNEDHLKNVIQGPLDELIAELNNLMTLFEGEDAIKDFTNPPSKKCKCYMQKIYKSLSDKSQNIPDYSSCRSDKDNSKNSAYVKMMASKYITSKNASLDAIAQSGGDTRGKYLCTMIFKNIVNIIDDQSEAEKFTQLQASDNKHILNQICVQQLRDVYSTIGVFKTEYFDPDEEGRYNSVSSCDGFPD